MLAQVPAGLHPGMRENRFDAGFGLRRIEDELRLSVLLRDGIVMIHRDGAIRVSIGGRAKTEDSEINREGKKSCPQDDEQRSNKNSPEFFSQVTGLGHGA
jgi:hypothetical protein